MRPVIFLVLFFVVVFAQIDDKIDWRFISMKEEGGIPQLQGYVPTSKGVVIDRSGVTIGTGVDLGRSSAEIKSLGLPSSLEAKLIPYAGLQGEKALTYLKKTPISLTPNEIATLDRAEADQHLRKVVNHYNKAMGQGAFNKLSGPQQTVLTSISYQWGVHLENVKNEKIRNFWNDVKGNKWDKIKRDLQNDDSKYRTRRRDEGALLNKPATTTGTPLPLPKGATGIIPRSGKGIAPVNAPSPVEDGKPVPKPAKSSGSSSGFFKKLFGMFSSNEKTVSCNIGGNALSAAVCRVPLRALDTTQFAGRVSGLDKQSKDLKNQGAKLAHALEQRKGKAAVKRALARLNQRGVTKRAIQGMNLSGRRLGIRGFKRSSGKPLKAKKPSRRVKRSSKRVQRKRPTRRIAKRVNRKRSTRRGSGRSQRKTPSGRSGKRIQRKRPTRRSSKRVQRRTRPMRRSSKRTQRKRPNRRASRRSTKRSQRRRPTRRSQKRSNRRNQTRRSQKRPTRRINKRSTARRLTRRAQPRRSTAKSPQPRIPTRPSGKKSAFVAEISTNPSFGPRSTFGSVLSIDEDVTQKQLALIDRLQQDFGFSNEDFVRNLGTFLDSQGGRAFARHLGELLGGVNKSFKITHGDRQKINDKLEAKYGASMFSEIPLYDVQDRQSIVDTLLNRIQDRKLIVQAFQTELDSPAKTVPRSATIKQQSSVIRVELKNLVPEFKAQLTGASQCCKSRLSCCNQPLVHKCGRSYKSLFTRLARRTRNLMRSIEHENGSRRQHARTRRSLRRMFKKFRYYAQSL